ncbi:MAG: hypothetical protein HYY13_04975 [Nitrospirae bacterium]|nr:hypothetical protein [Nitrospirota bacterium]
MSGSSAKTRDASGASAAHAECEPSAAEREEWIRDFEAAGQWSLDRRLDNAFIRTYKPVLDDVFFRAFTSVEAYRRWCETAVPSWLGYGRSV